MSYVKYLILFTVILNLGACGRGFVTVNTQNEDISSPKPLDTTEGTITGPIKPVENDDKKEPLVAISELWTQEIPNKYDDVGDFFRVKEVPGLKKEYVIDSVQMGAENSKKTIKLIRGKLRLSKIKYQFDTVKNKLEVSGDVIFNDGQPLGFKMSGTLSTTTILLSLEDEPASPLKNVFRAKSTCASEEVVESCKNLTIDFYYRDKNNFYTDQLISKEILFDEIKKIEEPISVLPDSIFANIPDENLTDYEKSQKKGFRDGVVDPTTLEELPYYFAEPSIDDVAILFPDVSREIEEQRNQFFKAKKKIKTVPKLTGDEKIPEQDPPLPPTPTVNPAPTPTPAPAPAPAPTAVHPKPPQPVGGQPTPSKPPTVPPVIPPKPNSGTTPKPPVVIPGNTPKPPVAPEPKPPVTPAPKPPAVPIRNDPSRPIDQAWGKPHSGMRDPQTKKMVYLTQSNSILEAAQKLGSNAGFEVRHPTRKRHYATYDMVEMVVNLGEWLKQNLALYTLSVSDSANINGGPIGQHESHKTGLDIDLAYLTKNPKMVFMRMDVPNKGGYTHSDFAAAEQWQLMKVAHEVSSIEVIYVNRNIKNEMCKQALKAGDLTSKTDTSSDAARILTKMIVIDSNHGDHWHVRLDCLALKIQKFQRHCIPHPQLFVGPECKNVKL